MASRRAVGAVFTDDVQAAEAVRALYVWNRAQRPRPLRDMCVVGRRASGRARYLPYLVPRARGGAWRGLKLGLTIGAIVGAWAGASRGTAMDITFNIARTVNDVAVRLTGGIPGFNLGDALDMASATPKAGGIALGVAYGIVGAIAGAVLGAIIGALLHRWRGFTKKVRQGVVEVVEPGGGAVVAWAREDEADGGTLGELRRLGGEPWPHMAPPRRELDFPTAETA